MKSSGPRLTVDIIIRPGDASDQVVLIRRRLII